MALDNELGHNAGNHTFVDRFGREWDVTITMASAKRVGKSDFSEYYDKPVSLISPSGEFFQELVSNAPLSMALIWAIVGRQASRYSESSPLVDQAEVLEIKSATHLEAEQKQFLIDDLFQYGFMDGIDQPTAVKAIDALWESLLDFFPQAKTALSTLNSLRVQAREKLTTGLAGISEKAMSRKAQNATKSLDNLLNQLLSELNDKLESESNPSGETSKPVSEGSESITTSE